MELTISGSDLGGTKITVDKDLKVGDTFDLDGFSFRYDGNSIATFIGMKA